MYVRMHASRISRCVIEHSGHNVTRALYVIIRDMRSQHACSAARQMLLRYAAKTGTVNTETEFLRSMGSCIISPRRLPGKKNSCMKEGLG